mmetsp:Transcript_17549/g.31664  ORF Transcript_17549/g.31664 Transcript_17549/m.31664 type:complete len:474 (+) Transcript_17549:2475-3896(+)|eukprot:CAMPEP_0204912942 /NCGR_PEP_ID=MMETSP1397-20131031/11006_1 /ASSEMBLY_ACC=CAM_ASM_000891 /TAXON_ID=49980 /ORGANISM="Climacostomum Climacostomum virens, Strain Stock W-24" /LENGTH=473 /DNA_ID=CAMNT_0052084093 /DNA_START=482 /DNA_END=1903 /DNA_ORIENTATION=-
MQSPLFSYLSLHDVPERANSAPPKLDSRILFAYPLEYASAFSENQEDDTADRWHGRHTISMVQLTPQPSVEEVVKCVESENQTRSRSTSFLVSTVVDSCITDEETPPSIYSQPTPEIPPHLSLYTAPEFTPNIPYTFFSQNEDYDASYFLDNAYAMAKDQVGCRILQKKLEESDPYFINAVYRVLEPYIVELMVDPFGNYFCQKMIEVLDQEHLDYWINICESNLVAMSLSPHGTRAVQKLIEVVGNTKPAIKIIRALKPSVTILAQDINSNHVIQRCLNSMQSPLNQFIFDAACTHLVDISTLRHGCCVLQRCLDAADSTQRERLVSCIVDHAVELVQDAYGNYVVQYVLDLYESNVNAQLAQLFMSNMLTLARQKFSSNVIEKCLQQNEPVVQDQMIKVIGSPANIAAMLLDQYANYVLQRALTLAKPPLQLQLLKDMKPHLETLKRLTFGKRVHAKLLKKYPQLTDRRNY